MDFRLTDEQQLWKDTLHAFMEKEVGREHDASREFPEEAYRTALDDTITYTKGRTQFDRPLSSFQALGGYAQLPEYDMERYFREAEHAMVGGGASEIQRTIIAREMGL